MYKKIVLSLFVLGFVVVVPLVTSAQYTIAPEPSTVLPLKNSGTTCTATTAPYIKLNSPITGGTLNANGYVTVTWNWCNVPVNSPVEISLRKSGQIESWPLSNTVQKPSSYYQAYSYGGSDFMLLPDVAASNDYVIHVVATIDKKDNKWVNGYTGLFSIKNPKTTTTPVVSVPIEIESVPMRTPVAQAPTITTTLAQFLFGPTEVTLSGNYKDNGSPVNKVWFEYGKTQALGTVDNNYLKPGATLSGSGPIGKTLNIFTTGQTYYYKVCGKNIVGSSCGNIVSFVMPQSTTPAQQCGVKWESFTPGAACPSPSTIPISHYMGAKFACADGHEGVYPANVCKSQEFLVGYAEGVCQNRCSLGVSKPAVIPAKTPTVAVLATVPVRSVAPATSAQISCPANFRLGTASSLVTESQKRLVSLGFLTMPRGAAYGFWGQASFDAWQRCLKSQEGSIATRVNVGDQVLVPIVQTKDATSITTSGATLNGVVNPNGATLSSWFELASNYNSLFGPSVNKYYVPGTQMANNTIVSATASKLAADTTYHYRLISQYTYGAVDGAIFSFKTKAPFGPAPAPTTLHR